MTRPQPGDWFVTSNGPLDSTLAGSIFSNLIQWGTNSRFNHAGVCVSPTDVVEAQPGGARRSPLDGYLGDNTVWSDGYGLTDPQLQRPAIVAAAEQLVGVPYGWGDIVAIILAQKRLGKWRRLDAEKALEQQPWWVRRLARTDRLICSELVDLACHMAGVILFNDRRPFGLVSPGDLDRLLLSGTESQFDQP